MHSLKKQQGIFAIVVAISLIAIVAVAGLAIDSSHLFLNKTRLQNLMDIAALAAAKTLTSALPNNTAIESIALATTSGKAAIGVFIGKTDFAFINDIASDLDNVTFEYSPTLNPFILTTTDPVYVRVRYDGVGNTGILSLPSYFIQVISDQKKKVSASAVSAPIPTGNNQCNIAPLMMCAIDPDDSEDCEEGDTCYGYNLHSKDVAQKDKEYCIKIGSSLGCETTGSGNNTVNTYLNGSPNNILSDEAGNFAPIRVGGNGASVYENNLLFGGACDNTETLETETGNMAGPTRRGINPKFGIYTNSQDDEFLETNAKDYVDIDFSIFEALASDLDKAGKVEMFEESNPETGDPIHTMAYYPEDYQTGDTPPKQYPSKYSQYIDEYDTESNADANQYETGSTKFKSRLLPVPVADCSGGISGHTEDIPQLSTFCIFITQSVPPTGTDSHIVAELVDPTECGVEGLLDFNGSGPYKIVLFKDPDRNDS
jgi:hypothetical protein